MINELRYLFHSLMTAMGRYGESEIINWKSLTGKTQQTSTETGEGRRHFDVMTLINLFYFKNYF